MSLSLRAELNAKYVAEDRAIAAERKQAAREALKLAQHEAKRCQRLYQDALRLNLGDDTVASYADDLLRANAAMVAASRAMAAVQA